MSEAKTATPHPVAARLARRICLCGYNEKLIADLIDTAIRADPLLSAAGEMAEALKRWVRERPETRGQDCDCVYCETSRLLERAGIE